MVGAHRRHVVPCARRRNAPRVGPDIRYQYTVSGRLYASTQRHFAQDDEADAYPDRNRAEAMTAVFPVHDLVTVYFDPDEPGNATLDRCEGTIVAFVVGVLIVTVALFVLRGWWRRRGASATP